MKNKSNSKMTSNSAHSTKMPIRDGRSGKPGSSGSSSGEPGGWSEEAMRAGTGGPKSGASHSGSSSKSSSSQSGSSSKSKSPHSGMDRHSGEPSRQTQTASEKDKNGLV